MKLVKCLIAPQFRPKAARSDAPGWVLPGTETGAEIAIDGIEIGIATATGTGETGGKAGIGTDIAIETAIAIGTAKEEIEIEAEVGKSAKKRPRRSQMARN